MIIDERWVITGSYNWRDAAEQRNAEHILRIKNEEVNTYYQSNFFARCVHAVLFS